MLSINDLAASTMVGTAPHMGEPNLILFCNRASGTYTLDNVGNRKPVITMEELRLSAKESKSQKIIELKGGSAKTIYLVGRLITPKLLPDWLSVKSRHKAQLIYPNKTVNGQFEFDLTPTHRVEEYNNIRGDYIKGFFMEVV